MWYNIYGRNEILYRVNKFSVKKWEMTKFPLSKSPPAKFLFPSHKVLVPPYYYVKWDSTKKVIKIVNIKMSKDWVILKNFSVCGRYFYKNLQFMTMKSR